MQGTTDEVVVSFAQNVIRQDHTGRPFVVNGEKHEKSEPFLVYEPLEEMFSIDSSPPPP